MSIIGSQSFYLSFHSNLTYICVYKTSNRIKSTINKTRRSIFFFRGGIIGTDPFLPFTFESSTQEVELNIGGEGKSESPTKQ